MTGHGAERGSASPDTRSSLHVALISTYDLGRQPFGLGSPAAWLREAGFRVTSLDLAVRKLDEASVREAGLIAIHLPMHTATRIAMHLVPRLRELNPTAHLCFYGLYAPLNEPLLRGLGADSVIGGEFEQALVDVARRLSIGGSADGSPAESGISLAKLRFRVPDRSDLGDLDHYARLHVDDADERLVGYTEASRGCKHLCRHCPIVPVYDGAFRIVQRTVVLADVERQVSAGARHITFGDPDFFNGIGHALSVVRDFHERFPAITYDVTIKVEHLLKHAEHLETLRRTGCLFVTSAVESIDDRVLVRLDKGHTHEEFVEVVKHCRSADLMLHPTFVAFHPWISIEGYRELLRAIADLDLVEQVAPVQLALRLLITASSKLLDLPEVRKIVGPYDKEALVYRWRHPDPEVDALQKRVQATVEDATGRKLSRAEIFGALCDLAGASAVRRPAVTATGADRRVTVPYLTEPWYC